MKQALKWLYAAYPAQSKSQDTQRSKLGCKDIIDTLALLA